MTVDEMAARTGFTVLNRIKQPDRQITSVYCCDLLSAVMGKAPADSAWVTIMGNINVVAVSALADTACVIIADGAAVEGRALEKADEQGVIMLRSELPVFETAKLVDGCL
ncbi:MAG: hypothetical protein FWH01_10405 [Oscillospiraceae bacterium]|nr:hypothetical protein [Oscillospiraceae bacterium]